MTKSKHELANITISILIDFDAIFDFDFKIVTALHLCIHLYAPSYEWPTGHHKKAISSSRMCTRRVCDALPQPQGQHYRRKW